MGRGRAAEGALPDLEVDAEDVDSASSGDVIILNLGHQRLEPDSEASRPLDRAICSQSASSRSRSRDQRVHLA